MNDIKAGSLNDNSYIPGLPPRAIRMAFPAYSIAVVVGSRAPAGTYDDGVRRSDGDAWVLSNDDGVRLAVAGSRRFIQMDARATRALIGALSGALKAYESATVPDSQIESGTPKP